MKPFTDNCVAELKEVSNLYGFKESALLQNGCGLS